MDLMYLPDAITYPSFRGTSPSYYYEPEEPLWTKQQQPTGKPQPQQPAQQEKRAGHGGAGGSCPLCKERQRRRLASYIRTKSRQDSECAIEEEQEEQEETAQDKQQK